MDYSPYADPRPQRHEPTPSGRKAAIYARVSTEQQKDEATIGSQVTEVERVIQEKGDLLDPRHIYSDDGYTGELLARPALDRLRDDARARLFDVVYVYDRGRLSRRFAHQELILEELADNEVAFVSLHDAPAATPEEQVLQAMQGVFHEYDRIRIIERFRRGKFHKVRNGKILGYVARFGYTYVPRTRDTDGYIVVNEEEAEIVRQIFHWIADDGLSLRKIVLRLQALGVPPRRSKRGVWNSSTLVAMVKDEAYVGRHHYNKTEAIVPRKSRLGPYRRVKKVSRRARPREEWIELPVPALIDQDLFDRTQAQIQANRRLSPRNTKRQYLCQGLIYCPCGRRLSGTTYGRRLKSERAIQRLMIYRCTDRQFRFPEPPTCRMPSVRADILDPLVWETVTGLLTDRRRLQELVANWYERQSAQFEAHEKKGSHLESLQQSLRAAQQEETRYLKLYGSGEISADVLGSLTTEVRERRKRLKREFEHASAQPDKRQRPLSVDDLMDRAIELIQSFDFSDRKATIQRLVTRITAEKDAVSIEGYIPTSPGDSARLCSPDGNATNTTLHRSTGATEAKPHQCSIRLDFHLTVAIPPPDNHRGYSAKFIAHLNGSGGG